MHILSEPYERVGGGVGMRRAKRFPRKMQEQVFRHTLIIPLLILVLFSALFYFYVSQILIDREHVSLLNLNDSRLNQVEANLRELDYVTANINYANRLTGFLTDSQDWSKQSALNTVLSVVGSERRAFRVNLYPNSGGAVGTDDSWSYVTRTMDAELAGEIRALGGKKLLSAPYYTTRYSAGGLRNWFLSVYRAALDAHNEVIGTLEAVERCDQIFAPIISYAHQRDDAELLYIFDADGALIYPYGAAADEREGARRLFALTSENPDAPGEVRGAAGNERYQYVRSQSSYSGWSYISLQRQRVILRPVYRLILLLVCAFVVLLLLSVLISWEFSRRMVRPVQHLKHIVQRLRLDTLALEKTDDYSVPYEELDELFQEFQLMSQSLGRSLEELQASRQLEFKSRMTALQVQMNPHFYYNTLSCISILAEYGRTEEVTTMCQTLSELMRYITDVQTSEVTLAQELDIVRKYLYCMQMRYQESLRIEMDVDELPREARIPKLILQPLVENAVKYGTDCLPPWSLRVRGAREGEGWSIWVEDSGGGFPPEVLEELGRRVREIDEDPSAERMPQGIGGMGMINVYLRWKLYCHEECVFEFGNGAEGHACVRIGRRPA